MMADLRRRGWRKSTPRLAIVLVLLIVTLYMLYSLDRSSVLWAAIGGVFFCLFLAIAVGTFRLASISRNIFKVTPVLQQDYIVKILEDGVVLNTPISESKRGWAAFTGCWETPGLFLLSIGGEQNVWIPKRAFPANEVQTVRDTLTARIQPPK